MPDEPLTDRPAGSALRRRLLTFGLPLVALGLLYAVDLMINSSKVPRGATAAGVMIGGMSPDEAERRLRDAIAPREAAPVRVTLGSLEATVDPRSVDVTADVPATVAGAGGQPLNPITRLTSFFAETPVTVVTSVDERALTETLERLGTSVAEDPVEGAVEFVNGRPVPSNPRSGWRLDIASAADVFTDNWAMGATLDLPLEELPPTTTDNAVADAVSEVADPAVSGPLTVVGDRGIRGVVTEDVIAAALSFRPLDGRLEPMLDEAAIVDALRPQLASSEVQMRLADIDFAANPPVKVPAQDGRRVDYAATLDDVLAVLSRTDDREIHAVYVDEKAPPAEAFEALGPVEVIGEFQTSGFSYDSGQNIRRAAEQINGIVVRPGETFSLNAATNPRNAAAGYVEAGIIENGRPARGVGGGVSQIATTLYNAAYFAGMQDVEHHEHSYYISRYPAGREATVFGDALDLKFRNDGPTSVQIATEWTPDAITVRLIGIKRFEVTSTQGARSRPTSPHTVTIPAGEACSASGGAQGFTITDTRTLRDVVSGETRSEPRTVVYDPIPRVVCGSSAES